MIFCTFCWVSPSCWTVNLFHSLHPWRCFSFGLDVLSTNPSMKHNYSNCFSPALYIENLQSCECQEVLQQHLRLRLNEQSLGLKLTVAQRNLIASPPHTNLAVSEDIGLDSLCQLFLSASPIEYCRPCSFRLLDTSSWKIFNSFLQLLSETVPLTLTHSHKADDSKYCSTCWGVGLFFTRRRSKRD